MNKQPTERDSDSSAPPPAIVKRADIEQLQHFVTAIKTAEQQVGENIIEALQHEGTVAVLTTVILGPDGQQRVVSAALKPDVMTQVQDLLTEAAEEREDEEKCVGFHCLVKPKQSLGSSSEEEGTA